MNDIIGQILLLFGFNLLSDAHSMPCTNRFNISKILIYPSIRCGVLELADWH
jgi:hypothetical protein